MNMKTTRTKTVSATTPQALDEAIAAARHEITQRNEMAQFVSLEIAASQNAIYATIVWSG
jgi:hypothetical protein